MVTGKDKLNRVKKLCSVVLNEILMKGIVAHDEWLSYPKVPMPEAIKVEDNKRESKPCSKIFSNFHR